MFSLAGIIIYKAFAPTLKMMICIAIGYLITKRGIFPPEYAKGVSILSLHVGLPALIFSSVVSAFTPDNIAAFGPLAMVAILYMIIGVCLGWIVREVFYVPRDFHYGILVMACVSNWGNLPIAVVQTVALGEPFDPNRDVELGVAYISVFVLLMQTAFFPLGLHKLCALDFEEENLLREPKAPFKDRVIDMYGILVHRPRLRRKGTATSDEETATEPSSADRAAIPLETGTSDVEKDKRHSVVGSDHGESGEEPGDLRNRYTGGLKPTRKTSRASSFTSMMERTRSIPATAPVDAIDADRSDAGPSCVNDHHHHQPTRSGFHQPITPVPSIEKVPWTKKVIIFVKGLATPVSLSIVIAIPCGIISPLKALFVPVDGWSGSRVPFAPDNNPPLAFITDTAAFIGSVSIPAALILLGASFARLKMPANWRDLPLASIFAMTVVKMILLPVFGIFFVQALQGKDNLFPRDDYIRTFVAILLSGTPAAVNQLVVTQLYNPEGSAHTLASFLMLQYIAMPVLSTALAAIALFVTEQSVPS